MSTIVYVIPDASQVPCLQHQCETLSHLASRSDLSKMPNITISFLPGNHILSDRFVISDIHELALASSTAATLTVTILCRKFGTFTIERVDKVNIHGIGLSCSRITFIEIKNLTISDSLFNTKDDTTLTTRGTSMHIFRSSFRGNASHSSPMFGQGGTIKSTNSTITIRESSFIGSSAKEGGVIYADLDSKLNIHTCSFDRNKAVKGGAIRVSGGSSVSIIQSIFTNNIAEEGGALSIEQSNVTLEGSVFDNNTATTSGSSTLMGDGGAIFVCGQSNLSIIASDISNNSAVYGGGLFARYCKIFVQRSIISDNHATHFGGGMYSSENLEGAALPTDMITNTESENDSHQCNIVITSSSRIINNYAKENGGGLYSSGRFLSLEESIFSNIMQSMVVEYMALNVMSCLRT